MIILTSYIAGTYKAQIRSSPESGFKLLHTATCTESGRCAAKTVVRKNFGHAAAESVSQIRDSAHIADRCGDFFKDPQRELAFHVWTFSPNDPGHPARSK